MQSGAREEFETTGRLRATLCAAATAAKTQNSPQHGTHLFSCAAAVAASFGALQDRCSSEGQSHSSVGAQHTAYSAASAA